MRIILEFILAIVFFIWSKYFASSDLKGELAGMSIGLISAILLEFVYWIYKERKFIYVYWDSYKPFQNPYLRLTIAYIFNIEINGKYLLVKSNRVANTYQPVGGVYKYFYPEVRNDFLSMDVINDNGFEIDDISTGDLRLKLRNRKKLKTFLRWFFNASERELSPWREFYEELVATKILPEEKFKYIHYELVGQHFDSIFHDKHFKIDTFRYVDVYLPRFINEQQIEEIKNLSTKESNQYVWATEDEIMNGVTKDGKRIADHTHKIFHNQKIDK